MSALKFINSSNQQKSSTKQSLHNNQNLGHTMYQKLFQIRWANTANQFGERCQHFVSHSFNALRTLLTKHPAKRNYKEPTRLETNSKNILSKTKTVNLETKFQYKIKIGNILCPEFGNELLNAGMTVTKKWTIKSTEARISKPNFAKITSASSQKKILAEIYCREKQSLLFTEAVLGFNLNHASNGRNQRRTKLIKKSIEVEL